MDFNLSQFTEQEISDIIIAFNSFTRQQNLYELDPIDAPKVVAYCIHLGDKIVRFNSLGELKSQINQYKFNKKLQDILK